MCSLGGFGSKSIYSSYFQYCLLENSIVVFILLKKNKSLREEIIIALLLMQVSMKINLT